MFKRLIMLVFAGFLLFNLCGCTIIMGALADSAHAKQKISVSYVDALEIIKTILKTQNIKFVSADVKKDITEIKGTYVDDKTVRIFVRRVSDTESIVSVRAGVTLSGKENAEKILAAIIEASACKSKQNGD